MSVQILKTESIHENMALISDSHAVLICFRQKIYLICFIIYDLTFWNDVL